MLLSSSMSLEKFDGELKRCSCERTAEWCVFMLPYFCQSLQHDSLQFLPPCVYSRDLWKIPFSLWLEDGGSVPSWFLTFLEWEILTAGQTQPKDWLQEWDTQKFQVNKISEADIACSVWKISILHVSSHWLMSLNYNQAILLRRQDR